MQIKRLEFGFSKIQGRIAWRDPEFNLHKAFCGCYMMEIWCFYVNWLGDECYLPCGDPECECKKD